MVPTYDKNKTIPYMLTVDATEPRTVFHIGVLDAQAEAYLSSKYRTVQMIGSSELTEKGDQKLVPQINIDREHRDIDTVSLCLKGVDNFGAQLSFTGMKQFPFGKRTVLSDDSLDLIKPYIGELADAIREASEFSAVDEKN
jgi:hypothetical protein